MSGLASSTVKWLRCTIVSYCIVLYREASKHKELGNGTAQGTRQAMPCSSFRVGNTERKVQFLK